MAEGGRSRAGALVPREPALPAALDFEDLGALLDLAAPQPGEQPADAGGAPALEELLAALTPDAHEAFWRRVLSLAGDRLQQPALFVAGGAPAAEDRRTVEAVAALLCAFAEVALDPARCLALPPSFAQAASLCQELLLTIPDAGTQSLIASALERICAGRFDNCEDYYGGVLMFLITKCLTTRMTGADVSRLHKVRGLLGELDWEHESIESLKLQLLRCAASPSFMRTVHGPDLVSFFYTVHPSFTQEVHATVKNQVLYTRQVALKAYAVGLFKAWKHSTGGARVQVELCVQDWVVLAIRCARKSADRARGMLEELHLRKHEESATDLLCRLYGPVLWRDLKVANPQVRENAARLLLYVFPLIPNDLGLAEKETELARQIRLLRGTLEDPTESVRRAGVESTCVVLKNYWDIIPPADIADMLTILMDKCSHDKKAPAVRAAVLEGFGCILDNALSHPTMAAVLPQTAELLNDRSPVVCAAFVGLLNIVSQCRGVSVTNVVGNEALLTRLAHAHADGVAERLQRGMQSCNKAGLGPESPEVVSRLLARLMAPSLFQQDIVQQVTRCRYLMQHWPLALLALLTHVRDVTPVHERVKLGAALFQCGLREAAGAARGGASWADGGAPPKMFATTLRAVGVLLEGAQARETADGSRIPKELEKFVYEHIKEKSFLHLLQGAQDDSDCGEAARLREDLLFALSPLDPARLPKTARFVTSELELACRGGGELGEAAPSRLLALMRAAARWGLLVSSVQPAWERLLAAAKRLKQRKQVEQDAGGAAAAVEALLRDPELRAAAMPAMAAPLAEATEQLSRALGAAWAAGVAGLRAGAAGGRDPQLLGPAAETWPRFLGLVVRASLHVDLRSSAPDDAGEPGSTEALQDAAAGPPAAPVGAVVLRLARELTSEQSAAALEAVEAAADACGGPGQPPKKKARGAALPADVDCALQVHQRLLEALSATQCLAVLRPAARAAGEAEAASAAATRAPLEDHLWRWARAADALRPAEEGPRLPAAWVFLGRQLQQMASAELPPSEIILAARRLLGRVTDEVPSDDDELKRALQVLFGGLESEPEMVRFAAELLGESLDGVDTDGKAADPAASAHPRVKNVVTSILPSFGNLRRHLIPGAAEADRAEEERRRVFATATPLRGARLRGGAEAEAGDPAAASPEPHGGAGGQSSPGRSRSPAGYRGGRSSGRSQDKASLFGECFGAEQRPSTAADTASRAAPSPEGDAPPRTLTPRVGVANAGLILQESETIFRNRTLGAADNIINKHMEQFRGHMAKYMETTFQDTMQSVREELGTMVATQLQPHSERLDRQQAQLRVVQAKNEELSQEQEALKASVKQLQDTLAIAEQQVAAPIDVAKLMEWNRTIDLSVFTLSSDVAAAPNDIFNALAEWMQAANVSRDQLRLVGDTPQKKFILQCVGGAAGVARANALQTSLKLPNNQGWRQFEVLAVSGARVSLYVNPDKNAKDIRKEVQTKKLLGLVRTAAASSTVASTRSTECWARRPKGLVYVGQTAIVSVQVQGPDEATKLAWDTQAAERPGIDWQAVGTEFKNLRKASSLHVGTVCWNAHGLLLRRDPARRRRKIALVADLLRKRNVVITQEVHGFEITLTNYLNQFNVNCKMHFSGTDRPSAGGVAILIPWYDARTVAAAGAAGLPRLRHRTLEDGRAIVTSIENPVTKGEFRIMNIHNYDISEAGRAKIKRVWKECIAWSKRDPMKHTFIVGGDFNMTDVPTESILYPQPKQARRSEAGRANRSEPFWRELFNDAAMLEVCSPIPTHYTADNNTLRTIDRFFVSIEPAFAIETEVDVEVIQDAFTLNAKQLSDHAIIKLRMATRRSPAPAHQRIPFFIFKSDEYRAALERCIDGCNYEMMDPYRQWEVIKELMTVAAETARNELLAKEVTGEGDIPKRATLLAFGAAARAVRRQGARLAKKLINRAIVGERELYIDGHEAKLSATVMVQRALLWNNTKRMLILAGVRQGQKPSMGREENGHEVAAQGARALEEVEVVRDASAMVEALKRTQLLDLIDFQLVRGVVPPAASRGRAREEGEGAGLRVSSGPAPAAGGAAPGVSRRAVGLRLAAPSGLPHEHAV
ncbi:unnamed protein product [Prorocentrum cordatum]|uniref:Endonuclease/exonuclease/phosphatase domain-containing protein n=1 Tax=Prorocentrum cordatum TaxID=2364126 RepID=A0ABN9Q6B2_9DINO|nr:unnamed protein product [Polarella glacialis]